MAAQLGQGRFIALVRALGQEGAVTLLVGLAVLLFELLAFLADGLTQGHVLGDALHAGDGQGGFALGSGLAAVGLQGAALALVVVADRGAALALALALRLPLGGLLLGLVGLRLAEGLPQLPARRWPGLGQLAALLRGIDLAQDRRGLAERKAHFLGEEVGHVEIARTGLDAVAAVLALRDFILVRDDAVRLGQVRQ